MFHKNIYIRRREVLKKNFEGDLLLFVGNEESAMNYADNAYHFRQDSSFLYYFGVDHPGLFGVVDTADGTDYIFGNDLTIDDIVWMGSQPTIAERSHDAGIESTGTLNQFYKFIENQRTAKRKIHFLPAYRPEHQIKLHNLLDIEVNEVNRHASVRLITSVGEQRNIKAPEEVEQMEESVNVTVDMHLAAMRFTLPGMTEARVAARVCEVALASGGNLAYPTIATINGQTLHNLYHGNVLKSGDMLLLDAGAENTLRYAGDLSSTFPVSPKFTTRQKDIYQIALDAHEAAIAKLQPGINFKEVHFEAARTIFNGLKEMGFVKGDTEEAVQAGAHALFFPCGTGHLIGLDVHDMENLGEKYIGYGGKEKSTLFGLKSLRIGRELKPGFVLTIEPGIYFIPELIDLWKSQNKFKEFINYKKVETYKDFGGVRNEENFLITERGHRLLGKYLAKTVEEVETERAKAF